MLNTEIAATFEALSDEDKARLEQEAEEINAAQQRAVEEMKEPVAELALKRIM